jgi:hypothetical protein
MFIDCEACKGKGRTVETGFDGRTAVACGACKGAGEIELTREEAAIVEAFLADCAASLDGAAPVADVAAYLNPAPTVAPVAPGTRRAASPARWQSALGRALDNGVRVYQVAGTGQWIATSASKPGVCFAVTTEACECEAAQLGNDPVCQHRAALRCELGLLWPDAPTPLTPAPVAVPAPALAA